MAVLFWGLACIALAFVVHVAWWRLARPKRQTRALLLLFFGLSAAVTAAAAALGWPGGGPLVLAGVAQVLHVGVFVTAFTLAYVITYSAVEVDSPSLVMVTLVSGAGPEGLPCEAFDAAFTDERLVAARVADLVRDRMLEVVDGRYRMTGKGRRFVRIFIFYRWLMGAGIGG